MKNQYFGDINDYRKYSLLRLLSGHGKISTAVCWMLTPDDLRPDGHRIQYLREPEKWRKFDPAVFDLGVPILGICYGVQLFAHLLGGRVERFDRREYGIAHLDHDDGAGLFDGVHERTQVWMSHGDAIAALPDGFRAIARTAFNPAATSFTAASAAGES